MWCSAAAASVLWLAAIPTARAGGPPVGEAVLNPRAGGSDTAFTLTLPEGAACPGDSANDGYRIQSYMVPASVDPAALAYDGNGPTPIDYGTYASFREPLFNLATESYASAQTADAKRPGDPGPIVDIPAFSYGVYSPGDLPPGGYHIGIACTLSTDTVVVWDAEVLLTDAADDDPAQIRWQAVGVADGGSGSGAGVPVAAGLGVALAAVAAFVVSRRTQPTATSMEDS
jgi:hypothetical protein